MLPAERLTLFASLLNALRRRGRHTLDTLRQQGRHALNVTIDLFLRPPEGLLIFVVSTISLVGGLSDIHRNPSGLLIDLLKSGLFISLALLAVLVMRGRHHLHIFTLRFSVLFISCAGLSLRSTPYIYSIYSLYDALFAVISVATVLITLILTLAYWGKIIGEYKLAA